MREQWFVNSGPTSSAQRTMVDWMKTEGESVVGDDDEVKLGLGRLRVAFSGKEHRIPISYLF